MKIFEQSVNLVKEETEESQYKIEKEESRWIFKKSRKNEKLEKAWWTSINDGSEENGL